MVVVMERKDTKMLVLVALVLAVVFETQVLQSKALTFCNMNDDNLMEYKPSVIEPNSVDKLDDYCEALGMT